MKSILTFILIFLFSFSTIAQINFQNGYFVDNNDLKINCFIKDIDWKNNPVSIDYKESENSAIQTASLNDIKEFGVADVKYERKTVNIDRSSDRISSLSFDRNPNFNQETLFLKILVEGDATLYKYNDKNLERYFYAIKNGQVQQLVYKRFYINSTQIKDNNQYKQQLTNSLTCKPIPKNVRYSTSDLSEVFIDYNTCINPNMDYSKNKVKSDAFNLSVRAGYFVGSFNIGTTDKNSLSTLEADFGSVNGYRFGAESEYIMPFNNGKWSLLGELAYMNFSSETITPSLYPKIATVDYKALELPIGIRHYFFINSNSKIFLNASYVFAFNLNSELNFKNEGFSRDREVSIGSNFAFGAGFNYLNKYALELRYNFKRDLMGNYVSYGSNFNYLGLNLSYNLF